MGLYVQFENFKLGQIEFLQFNLAQKKWLTSNLNPQLFVKSIQSWDLYQIFDMIQPLNAEKWQI